MANSINKDEKFLNQRSDKFTIVFNDNELHLFKSARNIIKEVCCIDNLCVIYASAIYHDQDKAEDGKHLKTPHYHLVIHVDRNYRIGTMINILSDNFHCNANQITIDKCNSLEAQSRYLLHLDDYDKHQYDRSDIASNKYDTLYHYLDLKRVADLKDLLEVVKHYNYNLEDIMVNIGNYDKWRKYINDLIINHNRRF